jgi:hypothetical protein
MYRDLVIREIERGFPFWVYNYEVKPLAFLGLES